MPFSASWGNLIDHAEDLPPDVTLITPLSDKRFTITDVQEHRIVIEFRDGESRPLQREQFESLYQRIQESPNGFPLSNIPTGAEPYAAVWSLHPRYEIDESEYVRKAEVDEEVKETRLQGFKDRLQDTEGEEAEELRQEIEELENRIDELTSFRTGSQYADR
jgi:hypothetical protein